MQAAGAEFSGVTDVFDMPVPAGNDVLIQNSKIVKICIDKVQVTRYNGTCSEMSGANRIEMREWWNWQTR